jgi:hypothetical protein
VVAGKSASEESKDDSLRQGSRNPFPLWGGAHDSGTTKEPTGILKRKKSNAAEGISGVQFS